MEPTGIGDAMSKLDAVRDVLTVKRVFGEAYEAHGVTVIPVAAVRGGGGGGGGEDEKQQVGAGAGLGVVARPVGVFVVDSEGVQWKPAGDITAVSHAHRAFCCPYCSSRRSRSTLPEHV